MPNCASDDPTDRRRHQGKPDPAFQRNRIHRFGDCLTNMKTVLPGRPIRAGSGVDSLRQMANGFSERPFGRLRRRIERQPCIDPGFIFRAPLLDLGPTDRGHALDVAHAGLDAPAVRRLVGADAFDDLQICAIFCREISPRRARRLDRIHGIDHDGMPEPQMLFRQGLGDPVALQLPFCFEVRTLSDRLVRSAPE